MTWFKLDDQFPRHPKVIAAGPEASWLFVAGGCYCAQYLTDGLIPKGALAGLTCLPRSERLAERLVGAGLWHDLGDSWEVHDFLKYNPSRGQVESDRLKRSEAGRIAATKRWASDSHSTTHPTRIGNDDAPGPARPDHPSDDERRKRRPPPDFSPTDEHRTYAESHALNLEAEREHWVLDCEAKNRTYAKLNAGFSTWLRQAVNFGRGGAKTNGHKPERCPKCANTGAIVVDGEVVDCVCIRAFS